jgi:hypothetical protein
MLDPKVAEDARQAWGQFMRQVNRMQCRMLTAMADQIDKQWADMVAVPAVEPTPVAWAVEYDDGIVEELFLRVADAQYYAKMCSELPGKDQGFEGRVVPLYRSPPPVAVSAEPRHDAATCSGERQEPDVGPKWDFLHQGAVLRDGDEWAYISTPEDWSCVPKFSAGSIVRDSLFSGKRYRRRVTPEQQATPDASDAWEELRHKVYGLSAQGNAILADALQKAASENAALRSEVERLRLRREERTAIRNALSWMLPSSASFLLLESMLKRLGGGE